MPNNIHIGIAEDHDMVRQGFVKILSDYQDMIVDFEARNGTELLSNLQIFQPQILLVDIKMPFFNFKDDIRIIRFRYPELKIIVVSAFSEEDTILDCVKRGANSFLPKHSDIATLVKAIYSVKKDGFYYEDGILDLLNKKGSSPLGGQKKLSEREIQVLGYLCENKSADEIARLLGVKEITIAGYKFRIFQKTGAEDIKGLNDYAIKHRYVKNNSE